jgi:hypothetical protein
MCYHVSKNECYRSVWCVVDGVNGCPALQAEFPMRDSEKLRVLEAEFRAKSVGGVWTGQVMAVDGVHFEQKNPGSAVENPLKYYVTRKGCYALLCIAGCDAECRFLVIDAFNLEEWMMVPVNDGAHADFDYHQSSNRVVIERAFGILIRRWGIFWRPLEVNFRRRAPLIKCCMLLHNYCINKRITLDLRELYGLTEIQPGRWEVTPKFDKDGRPVEHLKTAPRVPGIPSGSMRSIKREALIAMIAERGLKRPKKRQRENCEVASCPSLVFSVIRI